MYAKALPVVSSAANTVAKTTQRDVLGGLTVEWLCVGFIVWLFGAFILSVLTRGRAPRL
jgi:hypothetical protein